MKQTENLIQIQCCFYGLNSDINCPPNVIIWMTYIPRFPNINQFKIKSSLYCIHIITHSFVDGKNGTNRGQAVDVAGAVQGVKTHHILTLQEREKDTQLK